MCRCKLSFLLYLVYVLWLGQPVYAVPPTPSAQPPPTEATPAQQAAVMRQALRYALNLQFDQALTHAQRLEEAQEPTLASHVTEGLIAYFQHRWQAQQSAEAQERGHTALNTALTDGQEQLSQFHDAPWLALLLGTAAIFDGFLLHAEGSWQSQQRFAQGRDWLQQVLIAHDTVPDAHLGLGLLYFATTDLPGPLRFLSGNITQLSSSDAVHHLRQAITHGTFSQDVARTFLARLYEKEQRHEEAITLGQTLQKTFPDNGYYALLVGRNQCAQRRYADCAATLGKLAARLADSPAILTQRDDRFDLYYQWGTALRELEEPKGAFRALRDAINQDPQAHKDETLWAKYQLARLYEQRGQLTTARQLYETLLRGRNVDDLHQRATQRLTHLR